VSIASSVRAHESNTDRGRDRFKVGHRVGDSRRIGHGVFLCDLLRS
jgi:hypothetical protein